MANVNVKNSQTGDMGIVASKRSRYEKLEVAYGQIKVNANNPDLYLGDTAILSLIPGKEVINAKFVSNDTTPEDLEIFVGNNTNDDPIDFTLGRNTTLIDYYVQYIRGTGHVGAGNAGDGINGVQVSLFLKPNEPLVTYPNAATVGQTTATMKASVQPQGAETTVVFEYGLTTAYGTTVAATGSPIAAGTTSVTAVTKALTGLTAGTTYHFRAVATNAGGTTTGADQTFTTTA